jgi:hypothetical protein
LKWFGLNFNAVFPDDARWSTHSIAPDRTPIMQIRNIVQQALTSGYLTLDAEVQLRALLKNKYEREDFYAFMTLQQAAEAGMVRQESRELIHPNR